MLAQLSKNSPVMAIIVIELRVFSYLKELNRNKGHVKRAT
jgi:hypothetical protein